jgi:GST-like protein
MDFSGDIPLRVFESGSILVHLAERFDMFLPKAGHDRTEVFNWLMWQMGSTPFLGGGFGHFYAYAPEKYEYPINRYAMEVKRQLDVLDKQLANHEFIAGAQYSIADMAIFPWYGLLAHGSLYEAGEFLQVKEYKHLQRWTQDLLKRPAVQRGRIVNKVWGEEDKQLKERHSAEDFKGLI